MKILVTGGAGYVGSHCVRALCEGGHAVTVLDNLSKGHRQAVDARAELSVADLADVAALRRLFADRGFDAVMHFAALAEVGESVRDPLLYYRANVANTLGLLEVMRDHGVRDIVFSSSCAVYGVPPAVPITEDMPKQPISPYGRTKLAIEWLLEDCGRAFGLRATALRYFNAAGAAADGSIGEDHDPESHLIPRVLQVALGRQARITVFGDDYDTPDGTCIRDYVHVDDLAVAHRMAIERLAEGESGMANEVAGRASEAAGMVNGESAMAKEPAHGSHATLRRSASGERASSGARGIRQAVSQSPFHSRFSAYNLGTGRGVSVLELLNAARHVTGHPIPVEIGPRRPGDPPRLFADCTAATHDLGWKPRYTDIRETIGTAWRWHSTHPTGYS